MCNRETSQSQFTNVGYPDQRDAPQSIFDHDRIIKNGGEKMSTAVVPQSGVQLLMIIGAAFVMGNVNPSLGYQLLGLGVGAWVIYNLLNLGRQF
jgi:hypothetical protein